MTTTRKPAQLVQPGDVVHFLGRPHLIEKLEPYDGNGAVPPHLAQSIARSADGWGITLIAGMDLDVAEGVR